MINKNSIIVFSIITANCIGTSSAIASSNEIDLSKENITYNTYAVNKENEINQNIIPYSVDGGIIYFDTITGTIIETDGYIEKLIIPESINGVPVTTIGENAFTNNSSITYIKIPSSVTNIKTGVFYYCNLTDIDVENANKFFSADNGILFNKDKTSILCFPKGKPDASYSISDKVTSIGAYAFSNCINLKNIEIPSSIKNIGENAFSGCENLVNIKISDSVTAIGAEAFLGCTGLENIELSNNINKIEENTFSSCINLKNLKIPNNVTSIEAYAFSNCNSLSTIEMSDSLTFIKEAAFSDCKSLKNINIPNEVISIGNYAFDSCTSLVEINIPKSITNIEEKIFENCQSLSNINVNDANEFYMDLDGILFNKDKSSLLMFPPAKNESSYSIPDSVKYIRDGAFSGCVNLKNVIILNSVVYIGKYAFNGCTGLTEINIPSSISMIDFNTFSNCSNLEKIKLPDTISYISAEAFSKNGNLTIYSPSNSYVKNFAEKYEIKYVSDSSNLGNGNNINKEQSNNILNFKYTDTDNTTLTTTEYKISKYDNRIFASYYFYSNLEGEEIYFKEEWTSEKLKKFEDTIFNNIKVRNLKEAYEDASKADMLSGYLDIIFENGTFFNSSLYTIEPEEYTGLIKTLEKFFLE